MQFRREKYGYWLILSKGEEVRETISAWARKNRIGGAQVWGIGAVENAELGYFSIGKKEYERRKFNDGSYELLSCMGNISEDGLHAHMAISKGDFLVRGGHLISAKISVFGEFFVLPTKKLVKVPAPDFRLRKIELKKK
jgi:predicted DNA-binding protein with PD1-like motif